MVHWELTDTINEGDVELVVQRALDKYPGEKPRIISDNGLQFIAKDFKILVRLTGLSHVRASPYYPQGNGKLERFHGTLKDECIRLTCPATKEEAENRVQRFVQHYNHVRSHSAIGYVCPADKLAGIEDEIASERDRKLAEARRQRELARRASCIAIIVELKMNESCGG